jgi:hypothetical protein
MKSLEPWPRGIANGVLSLRDIIYYLSAYEGKPYPYIRLARGEKSSGAVAD